MTDIDSIWIPILYRVFIYSWNILFDSQFLIKVNAKLALYEKMSVEANL